MEQVEETAVDHDSQKAIITSPQLDTNPGTQPDPSTQFAQLEELNAEAAKSVYTPLQDEKIRLVVLHAGEGDEPIRCTVFNTFYADAEPYHPLSYVWGPQASREEIILNGRTWRVTKNLHAFLQHIRSPEGKYLLWIDALSINQSNVIERNAQVQTMRDIYASGLSTIIWLTSEENPALDSLFSIFLSVTPGIEALHWITERPHEEQTALLLILWDVSSIPYWSRVWIVQELMYSRKAGFVYKDFRIQYTPFVVMWKNLLTLLDTNVKFPELELALKLTTLSRSGLKALPDLGSGLQREHITLTRWYDMHIALESTDRRDIVYGLHGCFPSNIKQLIPVDYSKTIEEVFTDIARAIITTTGCLNLIRTRPIRSIEDNIPSWVPHFYTSGEPLSTTNTYIEGLDSAHAACGITPCFATFTNNGRVLQAKGVRFGIIKDSTESFHRSPYNTMTIQEYLDCFRDENPTHSQAKWDAFQTAFTALGVPVYNDTLLENAIGAYAVTKLPETSVQTVKTTFRELKILTMEWRKISFEMRLFDHFNRRFFSFTEYREDKATEQNLGEVVGYGVGNGRLEKGDQLCVLFGCSEPVILRPVYDHHILIGHAYVHGYMDGEAVRGVEAGKEEPVDFFIH